MVGRVYLEHPVLGIIEICEETDGISSVEFVNGKKSEIKSPLVLKCKKELEEYFYGDRIKFSVTLDVHGTDFQVKCWKELSKIPYGKSISYKVQAENIGNPKAVRAVGGANSKNPISIIIPCHRVIGKNGKLTGYASGLWRKEYLLKREGEIKGR
ncbi:methylated-DNA--[protein]-cysteine S-methyltransferase [Ilyobacter polytropus]|uniref:Methylated-DNA--protein-cysteine methyltransferase n=1 Tax=Ilyobacter polytropus (strain ATCC 51220 / DSM 2926 / LMG 16218 / CuHBu1) TaxID=572544 RepID=E3HA41_ILYPC|nr:methylated-DNA--[protein]-cysteine S-methyltransferase [Ilyobacter polytropus]ADO83446.1 methylated-DNA/protein-cysteinemethyltransferase [Ilyobacter polytropus DSM 2926]